MKKANGELVAVLANQIARARHALKVQEQRLFLWLVGQVDPFDDEDLQPLRLSVADYAALFGRQGQGSIYQELEEATTGLLSKVVEIAFPGRPRRKKIQWLSKAEYLDGEGIVLVQLHEELKPFLWRKEGIRPDSAAGDPPAQEPVRDGVLSDVLLLVRLQCPLLDAERGRAARMAAYRRRRAGEGESFEVAGDRSGETGAGFQGQDFVQGGGTEAGAEDRRLEVYHQEPNKLGSTYDWTHSECQFK